MPGEFVTVGYLVPSRHQRSFKVIVDGRFLGLIQLEELHAVLQRKPLKQVKICRYVPKIEFDFIEEVGPRGRKERA